MLHEPFSTGNFEIPLLSFLKFGDRLLRVLSNPLSILSTLCKKTSSGLRTTEESEDALALSFEGTLHELERVFRFSAERI